MRPKSELLRADEYGRRFTVLRITEMLLADAFGEEGPVELRIEQGMPGWDDLVEYWSQDGGASHEHRWQVKRQSTPLAQVAFEEFIRTLAAPGASFVGHLGLRDLVDVQGVGPVRDLRELCLRLRGEGISIQEIDLAELHATLTLPQRRFLEAVVRVLKSITGAVANEQAAFQLLRRLRIDLLYGERDLKEQATRLLRCLFDDADAAWSAICAHVAANPDGHVRFIAKGLRGGLLRKHATRNAGVIRANRIDLEAYLAELRIVLGAFGGRVETGLKCAQQRIQLDHLCDQLASGVGVLVTGPSGCGKTNVLRTLALRLSQSGTVPVWADAKRFEGRLGPWLDDAASPLERTSFPALVDAAHADGRSVVLFIDGLEEAGNEEDALLNAVAARATHSSITLALARRRRPRSFPQEKLQEVSVLSPDLDAKRRLFFMFKEGCEETYVNLDAFLDGLHTPLEVQLAALAFDELPSTTTLYHLFEAYVRRRLDGDTYIACMKLLTRLAEWMRERFVATISPGKLLRLAERDRPPAAPDLVQVALRAGLLVDRSGYVAFRHELFCLFFEAESLLWRYDDDTAKLAEMLERPRYHDLGQFLIGALDDPRAASTCIRAISNDALLMEVFDGRLGFAAKQAFQEVAHELLYRISQECAELTLPTTMEEVWNTRLNMRPWSVPQWSLACTVGAMVARGHFWEPLIAIIRRLDERWYGVKRARGRRANLLRDETLKFLYTGTSLDRKLAISALLDSARMARWCNVDAEQGARLERVALDILQSPEGWTPGVLLLVGNMRVWHSAALRGYLPGWFDACWETGLDHLRLVAAESLSYGTDGLEEAVKEKLVQRLQEIWRESTERFVWGPLESVMEALIAFGALEHPSEGYISIASREVEEALAHEETEQSCLLANKVYEFQFEEHIGDAYCAALEELDAERRLLLLLRAAKAAARDDKSAPSLLIQDLLRFDDSRVGAALVPWGRVPIRPQGVLNDGPEAFVYATAGLGRLGHALPDAGLRDVQPLDQIWRDMGKLIHALHARSTTPKEPIFRSIWSDLQRADAWFTIDVVRQVSSICQRERQSSRNLLRDPVDHFPAEICRLATRALRSEVVDCSFRRARWDPMSNPVTFAIHVLAVGGDTSCVDVLQKLMDDPDWGADAVRALREIRGRDPK